MLRKALAVATIAGAVSFLAAPVMAQSACVDLYVYANGELVNQEACLPPA